MKKILRIISVLSIISSVLIPYPLKIAQGQNSSVTQLLITEVASTPSSDEEWIEIYNPGPNTYTLNTLTFFENDTNHGVTPLHGEMSINAGTVAIIANKAELFITKHPEYSGLILDSSWSSLKQEGEPLALKMSGVVVDSITYGDTTNEAETSQRKFAVETAATWEAQAATAGVLMVGIGGVSREAAKKQCRRSEGMERCAPCLHK